MHIPLEVLALPLRLVPEVLRTQAVALALNEALGARRSASPLGELEGRVLAFDVTDCGLSFTFEVRGARLWPALRRRPAVRIRGSLRSFWLLATRQEDPDTLFFQRRLSVEGDTALGVHVKNLIDAAGLDVFEDCRAVFGEPAGGVVVRLLRRIV